MERKKPNVLNLIKALVFGFIVLLIFWFLSNIFTVDPQGAYDFKSEYFSEELDKDYADVLFFGASQTGRSISPTTIFDESGVPSYVFSTPGMPIYTFHYKIKELIEEGHSPELVVLDISSIKDEFYFNDPLENEDRYRTGLEVIYGIDNKVEYVADMEENYNQEFMFDYLFPIFSFHEVWKTGEINESVFVSDDEEFNSWEMGAVFSDVSNKVKPIKESYIVEGSEESDPLEPVAEEYFIKTVELLRENDIKVLAIKYLDSVTDTATHNSYQNLCDENGIDFLNLNLDENKNVLKNEYGLSYEEHFYNYKHNNVMGMVIVSRFVSDYLGEHYDLEDYSADKDYQFMFDYHQIMKETYPKAFEI